MSISDEYISQIVDALINQYSDVDLCVMGTDEINTMVSSVCNVPVDNELYLRITNLWMKKLSSSTAEYDKRWDASL